MFCYVEGFVGVYCDVGFVFFLDGVYGGKGSVYFE